MSTKNLARTVIEGGRTRWSCWYRRHTLREVRAAQRTALGHVRATGGVDEVLIAPRKSAHTAFHDKLGPAMRWLERQVGRPWDLVRSELFDRFDIRTTPGRHIVFDHMLRWVEDRQRFRGLRRFEIDAHGVLRRGPWRRHRHFRPREPLPRAQHELEAWLAGRRVAERGGVLFWFAPTPSGAYRQHRRLDDEDAGLWRSLPGWFREQHQPGAPLPIGT